MFCNIFRDWVVADFIYDGKVMVRNVDNEANIRWTVELGDDSRSAHNAGYSIIQVTSSHCRKLRTSPCRLPGRGRSALRRLRVVAARRPAPQRHGPRRGRPRPRHRRRALDQAAGRGPVRARRGALLHHGRGGDRVRGLRRQRGVRWVTLYTRCGTRV